MRRRLLLVQKQPNASVVVLIACLFGVIGAKASNAAKMTPDALYRLYLPKVALSAVKHERLEEFRLTVTCGHIEALQSIPYDWEIAMSRESGIDRLHETAGHGATRLGGTEEFNGSILISDVEENCFDVSTAVVISGSGEYDETKRLVRFARSSLKLVRVR